MEWLAVFGVGLIGYVVSRAFRKPEKKEPFDYPPGNAPTDKKEIEYTPSVSDSGNGNGDDNKKDLDWPEGSG